MKFYQFPDPEESEEGIVCYGGDLSVEMLFSAYVQGIFPWYNEDDPLLWWCPDPRFVLLPEELHVPDRLRRFMKSNAKSDHPFTYTMDHCFLQVIQNCAGQYREDQDGTWIHPEMIAAYTELHRQGIAHSFEVWQDGVLAGGFYGVLIGSVFCGESMFTTIAESTKCGFVHFVENFRKCGGKLIDSQVYTDNIARYGGRNISRTAFLRMERDWLGQELTVDLAECYR